jgi:hypothetical protein
MVSFAILIFGGSVFLLVVGSTAIGCCRDNKSNQSLIPFLNLFYTGSPSLKLTFLIGSWHLIDECNDPYFEIFVS